ncbi:MAG: hypothetical protein WB853_19020 [Desulfobacterales bacterium]
MKILTVSDVVEPSLYPAVDADRHSGIDLVMASAICRRSTCLFYATILAYHSITFAATTIFVTVENRPWDARMSTPDWCGSEALTFWGWEARTGATVDRTNTLKGKCNSWFFTYCPRCGDGVVLTST